MRFNEIKVVYEENLFIYENLFKDIVFLIEFAVVRKKYERKKDELARDWCDEWKEEIGQRCGDLNLLFILYSKSVQYQRDAIQGVLTNVRPLYVILILKNRISGQDHLREVHFKVKETLKNESLFTLTLTFCVCFFSRTRQRGTTDRSSSGEWSYFYFYVNLSPTISARWNPHIAFWMDITTMWIFSLSSKLCFFLTFLFKINNVNKN